MKNRIRQFQRRPGHSAERPGDAPSSQADTSVPRRRPGGFSLVELIVTLGLVAVALGIAIPRAPRSAFAMWRAHAQLMGDLRQTRADALTRGDHFLFEVLSSTSYQESRMTWNGVSWVKNVVPIRTRTLPSGVVFSLGTGAQFEFNTRGLLVLPGAAQVLRIHESASGLERQITVWPSGQVAPI